MPDETPNYIPGPYDVDRVLEVDGYDIILAYDLVGAGSPVVIASLYSEKDSEQFTDRQIKATAHLFAKAPSMDAEIKTLKVEKNEILALLERCYRTAYRNGWEDTETTNEVLEEVHALLCNHGRDPRLKRSRKKGDTS